MKMHKSGCTLDTIHFTNTATSHNSLTVVEELSSQAFCKIAAPISPRRGIRNFQPYPTIPSLPIRIT